MLNFLMCLQYLQKLIHYLLVRTIPYFLFSILWAFLLYLCLIQMEACENYLALFASLNHSGLPEIIFTYLSSVFFSFTLLKHWVSIQLKFTGLMLWVSYIKCLKIINWCHRNTLIITNMAFFRIWSTRFY